jgi:hypothetical protein
MFFFNMDNMSENAKRIVMAIFGVVFVLGALMFAVFAISTIVNMIQGGGNLFSGVDTGGLENNVVSYPGRSGGCCFLPCCLPLPLFGFASGLPFLDRFRGKHDDDDAGAKA